MYLNCALVSSFLFVSAILGGLEDFAGGMKVRGTYTVSLMNFASGTFTVPNFQGAIGSGFIIGVGLDGVECTTASLSAGIQLMIREDGYYVRAWATFAPYAIVWHHPDRQPLEIGIGHQIKVTVAHKGTSLTLGSFIIQNLNTGRRWSGDVDSPPENPLCGINAYWTVGLVGDGGLTPLAGFEDVVFTDLSYKLKDRFYRPTRRDQISKLYNINQGGVDRTFVEVQDSSPSISVIVKFGAQG